MPEILSNIAVAEPSAVCQLRLPMETPTTQVAHDKPLNVEGTLSRLLRTDLTFKGQKTAYATHNLHAFAAKFPPQLPRLFINELTRPHEWVLDPMAGSGTTLVETVLAGRKGIGVDLDPLAMLIAKVKTTPLNLVQCNEAGRGVLQKVRRRITGVSVTDDELRRTYSQEAVDFFRYWFEGHTVSELYALVQAIAAVEDAEVRSFLQVVFSSVIITKSGGVTRVIHDLRQRDERRAAVVAYYYRDLEATLSEMLRVIAKGRAVVLVVGSSTIRGVGIKVPAVAAELAVAVGFRLVGVAKREILRDARMMPGSHRSDRNGIEARMHEEGVIGLIKLGEGDTCAHTRGNHGTRA